MRRIALPAGTLALGILLLSGPAAMASLRVVSLNLCTDQLLVLLAPGEVAGLSPLARNPALSAVAAEAARLPVVRASAEAVLRLHPSLVLAERYGAQSVVAALRTLGLRIVIVPDPQSFQAIRAGLAKVGALLGKPARAAALIARMDAVLSRLPHPAHRQTAIMLWPRGLAAGPGSLAGRVLAAAGYRDAARGGWLPLERLLAAPPDLLILPEANGLPSLATRLLDHPALARLPRRTVPAAWVMCGSPFAARAAAAIAP